MILYYNIVLHKYYVCICMCVDITCVYLLIYVYTHIHNYIHTTHVLLLY